MDCSAANTVLVEYELCGGTNHQRQTKSPRAPNREAAWRSPIASAGNHAPEDVYDISAVAELDHVALIRLEALPDPSLPKNGPGRHPSGNFQLSALRLSQGSKDGATEPIALPLESPIARFDYKAPDADVAGTVHESLKKVWHVWAGVGLDRSTASAAVHLLCPGGRGYNAARPGQSASGHNSGVGRK